MKNYLLFALAFAVVCSCAAPEAKDEQEPVAEEVKVDTVAEEIQQESKSDIAERALELCEYIPDHGIDKKAEKYMTAEYFRAYSEAFDAPKTTLGIGEEEFLYYFVSGNDGALPKFAVKNPDADVEMIDDQHAKVKVLVSQIFDDASVSSPSKSELEIVKVDGEWLISDFDNTLQQCKDYIKEMRRQYKSGEGLDNLVDEGASEEFIERYQTDLETFYKKYGK